MARRLTSYDLKRAMSSKGQLSKAQFNALGYTKSFKGWKRELVGKLFDESAINEFVSLKNKHRGNSLPRGITKIKKERPKKTDGVYDAPEWKAKRNKILDRDKHTCVSCGRSRVHGGEFHVHHMLYIKGKYVWEVPDYYLVTLCSTCHKKEHSHQFIPPSRHFNTDGTRKK
jgi:hypothetical protein